VPAGSQQIEFFRARHQIGDTRRHVVQCTPVATSRFAPYFTERRTVGLSGTSPVGVAAAFVPGTVVVRDPLTGTVYRGGLDVTVDYRAGQVARVAGGTVPEGATVEVAFVTPPITRKGPAVNIDVPASARPTPPIVHSITPAFAWTRRRGGQTFTSVRAPGHLRVYLERPWFVSGPGELLAVLVGDNQLDPTNPLTSSCWLDPVFDILAHPLQPSPVVNVGLSASSFPRASSDARDVLLNIPNAATPIHAIGHAVQFDADKRLWYADIQIQTDHGVAPFVHLRLARLQPNALRAAEDLRVSSVVDAGFHQIPASRTLSVTPDGNNLQIMVTGPAPSARAPQLTVAVQVGPPPAGDPALWEQLNLLPEVALTPATGGWFGQVQLPAAVGSTPQRVLVREYQILPGDPGKRITYFDCVEL